MRVGVHVSIAGGLAKAVQHAHALGCETMQIFSKSPRGWAARPLDPADVEEARHLRAQYGIAPFAVHASYLLNLAASESALYDKSIAGLIDELKRCQQMEADYLVLHIGCVKAGQSDGLERVALALRQVLKSASSHTRILLENTAGERGEVGSRFEELGELLERIGSDQVGVCFDTCHTFAAGYDLRTPAAVDQMVRELKRTVGLGSVQMIHANDSKKGLGCHVDRHEHIGIGQLGCAGFRGLLRHPDLQRIPMVLETPKMSDSDDRRNLRTIRRLSRVAALSAT